MKFCNHLTLLSVLTICLLADRRVVANDVPLEELVGSYSLGSHRWDGPSKGLLLTMEAKQLVCIGIGMTTYKSGILFIDFDRGLTKLDENKLPESGLFFPVRWGPRIYLIPKLAMQNFCDAINTGVEPEYHSDDFGYYLREKGSREKVTGDPELPAAYKDLLLAKQVEGKVVEISGGKVWADLGRDPGVRVGMKLLAHLMDDQFPGKNYPTSLKRRAYVIKVLSVEGSRCSVEGFCPFKIGTPITSRNWDWIYDPNRHVH